MERSISIFIYDCLGNPIVDQELPANGDHLAQITQLCFASSSSAVRKWKQIAVFGEEKESWKLLEPSDTLPASSRIIIFPILDYEHFDDLMIVPPIPESMPRRRFA